VHGRAADLASTTPVHELAAQGESERYLGGIFDRNVDEHLAVARNLGLGHVPDHAFVRRSASDEHFVRQSARDRSRSSFGKRRAGETGKAGAWKFMP